MSKKAEYDVFINIYKLALEFSISNEQILNELSHYLIDNLISKICIFLAQANGLQYQITSSKGNKKTFDFPRLYKVILSTLYPNVPDYNNEIRPLHDLRNLFQHRSESITLGIRSEFAIEYIRLTEIILREIGIIEKNKIIEPTNYLKDQYLKERLKVEYFRESKAQVDEKTIINRLNRTEKQFEGKIVSKMVKSDLNIRIKVYPLLDKGELFSISEFTELKDYLEKEARYGPFFDNFPAIIFNELSPNREGLQYIATNKLIGSILIQREGLVLYDWRYGMKRDPDNETLPVHMMSAYVLGFLNFLTKLFNKLKYLEDIKIIFNIGNISNWEYSPQPEFIADRRKHNFKQSGFTPIESKCTIKELSTKEGKQRLLHEIFDEILLCYGFSNGFRLREDLKAYLEKN